MNESSELLIKKDVNKSFPNGKIGLRLNKIKGLIIVHISADFDWGNKKGHLTFDK